ncbi:MAG: CGNR zinc finger domain-containing protein [Actinomycetes bacterium]
MDIDLPVDRTGPGRVALVISFVNTADAESGEDRLGEPAALAAWLREHGLLDDGADATADDVATAVDLREGLRDAVDDACDGVVRSDGARLARALAQLPVVLGPDLAPHPAPDLPPVRRALALVVAAVLEAQAAGTWSRVKVCARDACRWAFWDASRNRSGTWCSMRVCGNREKMRRRTQRSGG